MLSRLKAIVAQANSYVGTVEGSSRHLSLVTDYNKIYPHPRGYILKPSDAWCAAFVSVIMLKSGLLSFPFECGVAEMRTALYTQGCMVRNRLPQAGEILFFKDYSHVGICGGSNPSNGDIICIEGNACNMVKKQMYNHYQETFSYYASPWPYSRDEIVTQVINGWWGNGSVRESSITLAGYNFNEIQSEVNRRYGVV